MDVLAFEHHLTSPQGLGHHPVGAHTAQAGTSACCDQVSFSLAIDGARVTGAGFTADGCGAATAAASAAVTLVRGAPLLHAARIGSAAIAAELGGLSTAKLHAAELAADALRFGAPPHGGIAFGMDRLIALLAGRDNIRESIAFPKATSGADPLTGAPAPVDARQLRELGLRSA